MDADGMRVGELRPELAPALRTFVAGLPRPQGSMKRFTPGGKGVYEDTLVAWRNTMYGRFCEVRERTLEGPVAADLLFVFPRPKTHYRTGKNAHLLRRGSPEYPPRPDIDKLCRAVLDSLTDSQVITDDKLVTMLTAARSYAAEGELTGVHVALFRLEDGGEGR